MPLLLDELGNQLDPILLELGSSLYVCQGFEQTLIFLLAVVQMEDAEMAEGSFAAAKQDLSRDTLGRLLSKLRKRLEPPDDVEGAFSAALDARNWIAHHFMHDTAQDMAHAEGRRAISLKLIDLKRAVMRADKMANDILDEYLSQFDFEQGDVNARAERVWQDLLAGRAQ